MSIQSESIKGGYSSSTEPPAHEPSTSTIPPPTHSESKQTGVVGVLQMGMDACQ